MIPMATFVAELGMMSPAGPLMIATSRQKKNPTEYFRIMKKAENIKTVAKEPRVPFF